MMATSVRGSNAPDYALTDPEEAAGLEVVLTLAPVTMNAGTGFTMVLSGGIDQTSSCSTGCEYYGGVMSVGVVDVQVV